MKAGVTAMLFAYAYLSKMLEQFVGKLSLPLVSDEETGYERCTGFLFEEMEQDMIADCVLAGEPSGTNAISFASKGYMQFTVKIQTRGAIAGYSSESQSAITIASSVIQELQKLERIEVAIPRILSDVLSDPQQKSRYEARRGKSEAELLDKITVDITTIQGGDLLSVIAPECSFTVAVVIPVGADPYLIFQQANKMISNYPEAELILEGISAWDISDPNHEMVGILQDTVTMLGWEKPEPVPDIAISDCRHWRYRNIPAFWYGADGSRCSAANEYVDIEELLHLVRTYTLAALQYLSKPPKITSKKQTALKLSVPFQPISPEIRYIPPVYAAFIKGVADSFKSADLSKVINELLDTLSIRLTISCLLLLLGSLFHRSIARLLGANQVLLDDTGRYILILAFFAPVISFMILCGFMERLIEKPNVYLTATVCCLIGNILMNYLFIKVLHLGVTGAALATGFSYLLGFLIVIRPFLLKNTVINIYDGRFCYKTLKDIICNGSSEGVNYLATALMLFLFNRAFMNYAGENGVAAFTVINYIGNFTTTVMFGISDGIGSIISCNYGAGKNNRVAKTLYTALTINFLLGICVLCPLHFHSSRLINIFVSNNGKIKELAIQGAKIYAIGFLFNGYNIVMSGYHTSIGNALISALIAAGRGIIFIATGIAIFPFSIGLSGVWFTFPFAEISTFICCFGIGAIKQFRNASPKTGVFRK